MKQAARSAQRELPIKILDTGRRLMRCSKMSRCVVGSAARLALGIAAFLFTVGTASADVYTDATGDNYGGAEVDISNVVVTNDATNINFQINLNTAANIGPSAAHFAN